MNQKVETKNLELARKALAAETIEAAANLLKVLCKPGNNFYNDKLERVLLSRIRTHLSVIEELNGPDLSMDEIRRMVVPNEPFKGLRLSGRQS